MTDDKPQVQCRVRVTRGKDIAVGPGKMELLAAIRDTGSISGAARRMHMSYRRAWLLVETMNSCFQHSLVETATGGRSGGGALLTAEGEKVLQGYLEVSEEVEQLSERYLRKLLKSCPLAPEATSSEGVQESE